MKAYALLSDKTKWTQKAIARDNNGRICDPNSNQAVSWCLMGAIDKCYPGQAGEYYKKVQLFSDRTPLSTINDEFGYEAVIGILKRADV